MLKVLTTGAVCRTVSFGAFEFDPQSGELRKHGMRIRLQGQPVELLSVLLEHPGEVVTREELQKRLWPADTFVDFEHSLNAAVKRLRAALNDSAQSPRFVETLARRGYRFIAPLRYAAEAPAAVVPTPVPDRKPPLTRRRVLLPAAAAIVLVAAAGILLTNGRAARNEPPFSPIRSLAVLPLANLSGDRGQDYFADGMTDALRQHLEGISSLRVISRTSSMHYRAISKPLPEIARELNVDAVVEGSVLRSGDRVRINVELIHAPLDKRLWSNSYEGDLGEIFALQSRVARQIAGEIRVTLTAPERERLDRVLAFNADAYQSYSKGRFYWNKRTEENLKKAIGYFQQAVDKDPDYALAYDGLADAWMPLGWYGYARAEAAFPPAKAAILKALRLDDSLAEAHTSLAFVHMYYDRDWAAAEREFQRAIELNPNYANGHHWYAEFLSLAGRHEQAIAESQRARELDPLSSIINAWVSSRYLFARQYDAAIEAGRNAVEMDPNFAPARMVLGQAYEQKAMPAEAIAQFEKAVSLDGGASMYRGSLAHALGAAARRSEAMKAIEELRKMAATAFVSSYDLALAYSGLGDKTKALDALGAGVREHSPRVSFLGVDPRFDGLRADPRFGELVQALGLPAANLAPVAPQSASR